MTHRLLIPVTPGELLDRSSILRTKLRNITDSDKLLKVNAELKELSDIWDNSPLSTRVPQEVIHCLRELADVHQQIWDAESTIRADPGDNTAQWGPLIGAMRAGREGNDKRTELKARINFALGEETTEVKDYGRPDATQGQGDQGTVGTP
jgi:hypothetical protein